MSRPSHNPAPDFGAKMSTMRRKCGLTQAKLSELTGVSPKAIDYYERRAVNPNMEFCEETFFHFGVSIDEFLGVVSNRKKQKPGPMPQILNLAEEVLKLSKPKQKIAVQFLETLVKTG